MADQGEQRYKAVKVGIFDCIERERKKNCRESMNHDLAKLSLRLLPIGYVGHGY